MAPQATRQNPITHIVLFRYASTIPFTTLASHFQAFLSLPQRCLKPPATGSPYMLSLRAGVNRSWEPFNKGLTHAFVLEFASQSDLDYYLTRDPVHLAFSRDARAQGLIEDSVVMDIVDGMLGLGIGNEEIPRRPDTYDGSCHCGNVRFSVHLPPGDVLASEDTPKHVLCHCRTCQTLAGSPYSCNAIVEKDDLTVESGMEKLGSYVYAGASGKRVWCKFCKICTSHICHEQESTPGKLIVRTLLLKDSGDWDVGDEICDDSKVMFLDGRDQRSSSAQKHINGVKIT